MITPVIRRGQAHALAVVVAAEARETVVRLTAESVERAKLVAVAYIEAAKLRLRLGDPMAWSDRFSAITWAHHAGDEELRELVLREAREAAKALDDDAKENIIDELRRLEAWAKGEVT